MSDWLQIDPENGMLLGPDGCHYYSEHEAAASCLLGLCGCGDQEGVYNFLRECLMCFDRRKALEDPPTKEWVNAESCISDIIKRNPFMAAHALSHIFDNLKLTEHGSAVGGSWLTDDGERIVDMGPRENKKEEE